MISYKETGPLHWLSRDVSTVRMNLCFLCSPSSGYAIAVTALRTANDSITRVAPLRIMLTPTKVPIAQAELDGHCM